MRPKFIVLITVMTLLTTLLGILPKLSADRQPISRTGEMPAAAAYAPRQALAANYRPSQRVESATVPTVLAIPVHPAPAYPAANSYYAPAMKNVDTALYSFVHTVTNGNANEVVGVYVEDSLALQVTQQPSDNPNFVSTEPEKVTQFAAANRYRTIGLLAHNYLAGMHFSNLRISQIVTVIYGDGSLHYYKIDGIERYQALSPTSPQSEFVDLNNGQNAHLSASDVFRREYTHGDRVIFQTCIQADNDPSWGRLFIIASPTSAPTTFVRPYNTRVMTWF